MLEAGIYTVDKYKLSEAYFAVLLAFLNCWNAYRIPGNFRGAKFSRISRFLLFREIKFREIIAMPHPLILHTWIIRKNIFREFLFRENLAPRKFPGIR